MLNRSQIAERLTNLIQTQSVPLVVSIDGYWGTGKTFMLKRWQQDLQNQGYESIYFNAWEDDFCDDPLLAIIGQMSEHFNKEAKFRTKARQVIEAAKPLLRPRSIGFNFSPDGISSVGASASFDEGNGKSLIDEYLAQRATKDKLKGKLSDLSVSVADETGHPLVFIIDELDRCRPTFAVELLERIKHIFDVPNLVFVFGINRDELCKSLQSLYGEIEAHIYLRRFFDMEFTLPEADLQVFCKNLLDKFEIGDFLHGLSKSAGTNQHSEDFNHFNDRIPELWSYFSLSLRDIDHCVRLIAMSCKNLKPNQSLYPWMLGLFVALRFNNDDLYQKFIRGQCLASKVMNYVHSLIPQDSSNTMMAHTLALIEGYLYAAEDRAPIGPRSSTPGSQILDLWNHKKSLDQLPRPECLSERVKETFRRKKEEEGEQNPMHLSPGGSAAIMTELLIDAIIDARNSGISSNNLKDLAAMINLHHEMLRR